MNIDDIVEKYKLSRLEHSIVKKSREPSGTSYNRHKNENGVKEIDFCNAVSRLIKLNIIYSSERKLPNGYNGSITLFYFNEELLLK